MYIKCSTKQLKNIVMKRIILFLFFMFALSNSSAWAEITIIDGPVPDFFYLESPTPTGQIYGELWDDLGTTLGEELYDGAYIGDSVLSGSTSYDSNGDGIPDAFAGCESGLWYAESYINLGPNVLNGRAIAEGLANFVVDSLQLSIHWDFSITNESTTNNINIVTGYVILLELDADTLLVEDILGWHTLGADNETVVLDLEPDHAYCIYWAVDVTINILDQSNYSNYSMGHLTLELEDIGSPVILPPSEQVQQILEFVESSVDAGDLQGSGQGNSADGRLNALINMIQEAQELIEDGYYDEAYLQLEDAYKKCDGQSPPPDFVDGEAAEELADMIIDLMEGL